MQLDLEAPAKVTPVSPACYLNLHFACTGSTGSLLYPFERCRCECKHLTAGAVEAINRPKKA